MQSLTRAARPGVLTVMNATLGVMRSCGLLLLAACSGDPSLTIAVHHPSDETVRQTVVTVYFGASIQCSDIEFGDRTESELAAIAVDEVDVSDGGRVEVSRIGSKSIVARGYDAEHRFVTAGCQDVGEITAGTKLEINTQPTAVVAIDPQQPDRPFAERTIVVNMTDTNGTAIDGTVSWQLTGPDGAVEPPPAAGVATVQGNAKITVEDLGTPGPEAMRIRVPWATSPLPLVTAFDLSGATTIALPGGPGGGGGGGGTGTGHPSCDVRGRAGRLPSLVCLGPATLLGHRDVVELEWQTDRYTTAVRQIPNGMTNQFALFVDHDGSAEEPVYVIGGNAPDAGTWFKLDAPSASPVRFDGPLQNVVYVPRCNVTSNAASVGVQTLDGLGSKRRFFSTTGQPGKEAVAGEVVSAGCVSDVDKVEHQAVVASTGAADPTLTLLSASEPMPLPSTSKLGGSGFVAVATPGVVERRFAGTRLQATGTVVFEAVLAPEGPSYKLVERTEIEAAAPPTKILGGQLDQDGNTDLMWDLAAGVRRRVFQVSLAKQVAGVPLTAITSGSLVTSLLVATDFTVGNLDGGAADEMIVFTQDSVTIYSAD